MQSSGRSTCPPQEPSSVPSRAPSREPTSGPLYAPTQSPSLRPTLEPSVPPSRSPTNAPSAGPTRFPTQTPSRSLAIFMHCLLLEYYVDVISISPLIAVIVSLSMRLLLFRAPSEFPTQSPSLSPGSIPTQSPSGSPTQLPTLQRTRVCHVSFCVSEHFMVFILAVESMSHSTHTQAAHTHIYPLILFRYVIRYLVRVPHVSPACFPPVYPAAFPR